MSTFVDELIHGLVSKNEQLKNEITKLQQEKGELIRLLNIGMTYFNDIYKTPTEKLTVIEGWFKRVIEQYSKK